MTRLVLKEDEKLIEQNPRDKAIFKIMELQKDPASVKTKYWYSIYKKTFRILASRFFGLDFDLISANFDSETIRGFEELIIQRAEKMSLLIQILMYGIPLLGWLFIPFAKFPYNVDQIECSFCYRFLFSRKKLKKIGVDPVSFLIRDLNIKPNQR